jgi:hypothetical protein
MVRVWLVKKGWGMILFGLILFFVVGPIVYMFIQPYTPIMISLTLPPEVSYSEWLEALDRLRAFYRMSVGSGIGAIGIFFIIFGTMYFLATTTLEYMKKRRLAHRSKI